MLDIAAHGKEKVVRERLTVRLTGLNMTMDNVTEFEDLKEALAGGFDISMKSADGKQT